MFGFILQLLRDPLNECDKMFEWNNTVTLEMPGSHSPGETVFNTMTYRRTETVQRSGDFQSKQRQPCKGQNNI